MTVCTISAYGRSYRIVDPGGRVGSKVIRGEPYERQLLVDVHQQARPGTALDVGAHVGNHTLYMAAITGLRVHAFECHAPTADRLRGNVELNPTLDIDVHDYALGSAKGTGSLTAGRWVEFDPTRDDNGHLDPDDAGTVEVRVFDDEFHVDDLSIVKVDVEGTEAQVLVGMVDHLDRCSPLVYAETHSADAHDAIAAVLEPLGYSMTRGIQMGSLMERWSRL